MRCLLIELLPYHEEVFPSWLGLLGELGYSTDVYARPELHRRNILERCGLYGYRLFDLDELPERFEEYDFAVLNTLMGHGYDGTVPESHRPVLPWLGALGLPSISVVHEPYLWGKKLPELVFDEVRGGERAGLCLYRDGSLQRGDLPWKPNGWSLGGGELRLRWGELEEVFRSTDDGVTYVGPESGHRLIHLPTPEPSLPRFLEAKRHRIFTLGPHGARYLRAEHGGVRWIHPSYFGDFSDAEAAERRIAVPCMIDYKRKSFEALLDAAEEIRRLDMPIYVVGGARDAASFEASPNVSRLREDLKRCRLADRVLLTGPLSYTGYLDFVRRSAYVLPLVDPSVEEGAYLVKLSTALALGIAFAVPPIVSERIAEPYGLELETSYPGSDVAAGLRSLARLSADQQAGMRRQLVAKREELRAKSLETLRDTLEEIL